MARNFEIKTISQWRSLLCVPAHNERFVVNAPLCRSDAIILDVKECGRSASKSATPRNVAMLRMNNADTRP
ncbi:hypothetical protein [Mesorhizobium sp.]|uniref:hypothetical protein n=1 Tax=Mesorhizobium sp. TaxID=1871066 RepID=UPI000FEA0CDE|nr:hypothetical protein [Mesorhizobium sp.]RWB69959.1 MAG: hypothetical protein EOQ49_19065 [Mesorhizobium sp.]